MRDWQPPQTFLLHISFVKNHPPGCDANNPPVICPLQQTFGSDISREKLAPWTIARWFQLSVTANGLLVDICTAVCVICRPSNTPAVLYAYRIVSVGQTAIQFYSELQQAIPCLTFETHGTVRRPLQVRCRPTSEITNIQSMCAVHLRD